MKIHEIGESGLIDRIRKRTEGRVGKIKSVIKGIGDDTAVIRHTGGKLLLATTDTFVEGIHFSRPDLDSPDVGRKAMVANISDIIAMGGIPKYALVSLAVCGNNSVKLVDNLFMGFEGAAEKFGVAIVGGDTVKSPRNLTITLTLLGEVSKNQLVLRNGAEVGDKLLVTGTFGDSAAGLELMGRRGKRPDRTCRFLIARHRNPEPRFRESRVIAEKRLATSMIDSSDGLDECVRSICRESRVGARVCLENIPVSSALRDFTGAGVSAGGHFTAIKYALYGGEDFELVFTVPGSKLKKALKCVPRAKLVGEIVPFKSGTKYLHNGKEVVIRGRSFQHFKKAIKSNGV